MTCGLWFHRDDVFVRSSLAKVFESLANEPNVVRFKGVLRVGKEWVAPIGGRRRDGAVGPSGVEAR